MSISILTYSRLEGTALATVLEGHDPLIDQVLVFSDPHELIAAARDHDRICSLVVVCHDEDLEVVDQIAALDLDAISMVAVAPGDHSRGLEAIRRGAHDYLELDAEQPPLDPRLFFSRLHAAIARASVVIRQQREHRRMSKVLEHSAEGYLVVDASGLVLSSSPSLATIWPDGFNDLDTIFEALHPDDRHRAQELGMLALANPGRAAIGEVRAIDRRGTERWFEIRLNDQSADPAIGGLITNVRDITDRMISEREHRQAEERFRLGFENAPFGMAMCEIDGTLVQANEALGRALGHEANDLVGRHLDELLHPDALALRPLIRRLVDREAPSFNVERRFLRPDGDSAWVTLTMVVVPDADGESEYLFAQCQDITDQKRSADALAHQASHDDLTRLPNRVLLEERLTQSLLQDETPPTVLFLDVDNFKVINDGLGHNAGDEILIELAERLRRNVRPDDTAARFSGDEFAVVLRGIPSATAAVARAEHLLTVLAEPMRIAGETHFVTVSIGVARADADATAETVLRDADAAMYQAKALGRGRVELFQTSMHAQAESRLRTATRMRLAIDAGHFHVAYQPFISVADEQVIGMEALLRWTDPDTGPVSPAEFIPVAEQTGLIVQLGAWALDEALWQLRRWQDEQPWGRNMNLSVNLSARQLSDYDLVDAVHASITEAGVKTANLSLEITETAVMADIESSIGLMRMMRGLGVNLSIDDFGTGYSSLNYLKSLPLTTLKVDRSFIDGLGHDSHDTSIVEAVVALGHALGMRVHAEGVERRDQLEELRRIGCDDAQGWLWAPAMAAEEFTAWMAERDLVRL